MHPPVILFYCSKYTDKRISIPPFRCSLEKKTMKKAVQQLMLGKSITSEDKASRILEDIAFAGYDGIELNSFMIQKTPLFVRLLTSVAGMPSGKGGAYDWAALTRNAKLSVIALHTNIEALKKDPDSVIEKAKSLSTGYIVVTGLYHFDFKNAKTLEVLCHDLNRLGEAVSREGLSLLYHNHNAELTRINGSGERAYSFLIRCTDPVSVNFEFDSYWFADGGADSCEWMESLGRRMRLWHINDRGTRLSSVPFTPILKSDSIELGYGNMPLDRLSAIAKRCGAEAVVLESHRNFIGDDPMQSIRRSAAYLNCTF